MAAATSLANLDTYPLRESLLHELRKLSSVGPPDECWLWRGKLNKGGHGRLTVQLIGGGSVSMAVHRAAFFAAMDMDAHLWALWEKRSVQHTCNNTNCVNPTHLRLGAPRKPITPEAFRNRELGIRRGQDHGRAKLTWAKVRAIRTSSESDADEAERYGVTRATIYRIRQRQIWFPDPAA